MKCLTRLPLIFAILLISATIAFANSKPSTSKATEIDIRVASGGWGDASVENIQAVLSSAAAELLKYFPGRSLNPIIVEHNENGPVTLYRRGSNGETIVRLSVTGTYWAQFAYQFSHELTHILAKYENTRVDQNPQQWFEEALCITGSLFTLRQMAGTWKTSPPYSKWKSYGPSLRRYADDAMNKSGRQLASGESLAEWFKNKESDLRAGDVNSAEARDLQFVVANQLLPIFEGDPDLWQAVAYLNAKRSDSSYLQNYLNNWYTSAPEKYRASIREINYLFRE